MTFRGCVDLVRGLGLCLSPMGSFHKNWQMEPWHVEFILNTVPFHSTLICGVSGCDNLLCQPDTAYNLLRRVSVQSPHQFGLSETVFPTLSESEWQHCQVWDSELCKNRERNSTLYVFISALDYECEVTDCFKFSLSWLTCYDEMIFMKKNRICAIKLLFKTWIL